MNFSDLGLGQKTLQGVQDAGYQTPTPIQQKVIPSVLARRDLFGCAQTGTGKTASYTLPLLDLLEKGRARARMPRVLVLAPTRELAQQISEHFESYGKHHKTKLALIMGGGSIIQQERTLSGNIDILIATPGRLLDLVERGKVMLMGVEILVIDEADRMLDMGFIPDIEKIIKSLPSQRQTLMFSATIAPEVRKLAETFLQNPEEITVTASATTATNIQQFIVSTSSLKKAEILRSIIQKENIKTAIIFCNRKKDIATLCTSLKRLNFNVASLHGDLTQTVRSETLEAFKKGEISFLVASDVAARGIDVEELPYVFNFDVPTNAEEYVHRIGRTGRAGREGKAFTFTTPADQSYLKAIQKLIDMEIPVYVVGEADNQGLDSTPAEDRPDPKKRNTRRHQDNPPAFQEKAPKVATFQPPSSRSREPIIGFGDNPPAFMKNYFPDVPAGFVKKI
jgi:superfamily II DNA/RNA helicase